MKSKYLFFICLFFVFSFFGCNTDTVYDPLYVRIVTHHLAWDIETPTHESIITMQANDEKTLFACFKLDKIWTDGYNINPQPTFQWYYDDKKLDYGYWSSLDIKEPDSTEPNTSYVSVQNNKKVKVVVNWGNQTGSAETTMEILQ